jgi:hypothetical protein
MLVIHVLDDRIYVRTESETQMRLIDRAELQKLIEAI